MSVMIANLMFLCAGIYSAYKLNLIDAIILFFTIVIIDVIILQNEQKQNYTNNIKHKNGQKIMHLRRHKNEKEIFSSILYGTRQHVCA